MIKLALLTVALLPNLYVGKCIRNVQYSGLKSTYGFTEKVVDTGKTTIVVLQWSTMLEGWIGPFIKDKSDIDSNYENVQCPVEK